MCDTQSGCFLHAIYKNVKYTSGSQNFPPNSPEDLCVSQFCAKNTYVKIKIKIGSNQDSKLLDQKFVFLSTRDKETERLHSMVVLLA
mmetsp:Transcript_1185/g.1868  ORF Transcript_1185/g.1868 Transcript_1185/m.1868 type:complete len:87 (+) Transcript_1185:148-408(+)